MKYFDNDEELKEFIAYFKNELPENPHHYPLKVMFLVKWWKGIVIRNKLHNGESE